MLRLIRHSTTWLTALLAWFVVLWCLSKLPGSSVPSPFDNSDKILHFGYFAGGGFLLAGWRFRLFPQAPAWGKILTTAIIGIALVGAIDEWHQCYTPGRSGGDPWDWLADFIGATAGAFALKAFHRFLR